MCGRRQGEAAGAVVAEGRRPFVVDLGPSNSGSRPRKEKGHALKGKENLGLSEEMSWAKGPLPLVLKRQAGGGGHGFCGAVLLG